MNKALLMPGLFATCGASVFAQQGAVPKDVPHLDHLFGIVMENNGYRKTINNHNAASTNSYATTANLAANYYAVAHPSPITSSLSANRISACTATTTRVAQFHLRDESFDR